MAAALGLLVAVVTATPVLRWWVNALESPWGAPRGDVLIVLGGDALPDGTLGEFSYWRGVYAAWAWKEGGFHDVWVSGAGGVAESMGHFLAAYGVPPERIHLETRSTSTRESAVNLSRELAGVSGSKVLLTSDYHMFRARRAFQKAGLAVRARPIPDAGKRIERWSLRWEVFEQLVVEEVKTLGYAVRGWL